MLSVQYSCLDPKQPLLIVALQRLLLGLSEAKGMPMGSMGTPSLLDVHRC